MTLQLMEQFGVQASRDAGTHMYRIPRKAMANPSEFLVEGIVFFEGGGGRYSWPGLGLT